LGAKGAERHCGAVATEMGDGIIGSGMVVAL